MKRTLLQIAQETGTDKLSHGYIPFYEQHLPKEPNRLLEIGAMHGASLKMWKEYFPNTEISTLDLFLNPEFASKKFIEGLGVIAHKGDQGYIEHLEKLPGEYDVIIDDGSHRADHQWVSLRYLFSNKLKSGGVYVVEDLHCNRDPFFCPGIEFEDTILGRSTTGIWPGWSEKYKLFNDKIIFIFKA